MIEQLFIAEKKSMGKSIAQALFKNSQEKDGYVECEGGKYIITWAMGHLLGLAKPDEYGDIYQTPWKLDVLPCIPNEWKLIPDKTKLKQLNVIKKLARTAKSIVNACDSAREGALIFHYIAEECDLYKKPIMRLWTSSQTEEGIQKAYKSMKNDKEYKNLLNSAIVRSRADWLIGMNGTRAFSLMVGGGENISIGRVVIPVAAMIYDRCKAIDEFVKKTTYVVEATFEQNGTTYKALLQQEPFDGVQEAEVIAEKVKYELGKITEYNPPEKEKVYAPKLYNLTTLTSDANSKFGYNAKQVLQLAQKLYEEKYITYPRTNSNYVTSDEILSMRKVFQVLGGTSYKSLIDKADIRYIDEKNKRICNEKYVEDHHALLPTDRVPQNLDQKEQNIYDLIVKRFIAQCFPPAEYLRHVIKTEIEGYSFHTSFKELKNLGWKSILQDEEENEDEEVRRDPFSIKPNEAVRCTEAGAMERVTEPPKPYTEGKLILAMETAAKEVDKPELREALKASGIGTPATRADTIEKVKEEEYVLLRGKSLLITEKGKAVIEMLRTTKLNILTYVEYTAEWEKRLNEIAKGTYDPRKFLEQTIKFTEVMITEAKLQKSIITSAWKSICKCPSCKDGDILERKSFYGCSRYEEGCKFSISKSKYGHILKPKEIKRLIETGETEEVTLTPKDKNKPKYKAKLGLKNPTTGELEIMFSNKKTNWGKCPDCSSELKDLGKFLGCSSYPNCKFNFSKTIKKKLIDDKQLVKLFTEEKTDMIDGFKTGDGKTFSARLAFQDGKFKMGKF